MAKESRGWGRGGGRRRWSRGRGLVRGAVGWLPLKDFIPSSSRPRHPYIRVSNLRATPPFLFSLLLFLTLLLPLRARDRSSPVCRSTNTSNAISSTRRKASVFWSCVYTRVWNRGTGVNCERDCARLLFSMFSRGQLVLLLYGRTDFQGERNVVVTGLKLLFWIASNVLNLDWILFVRETILFLLIKYSWNVIFDQWTLPSLIKSNLIEIRCRVFSATWSIMITNKFNMPSDIFKRCWWWKKYNYIDSKIFPIIL